MQVYVLSTVAFLWPAKLRWRTFPTDQLPAALCRLRKSIVEEIIFRTPNFRQGRAGLLTKPVFVLNPKGVLHQKWGAAHGEEIRK